MATADRTDPATISSRWARDLGPWRCPRCRSPLRAAEAADALRCNGCAAEYPIRNDVLVLQEQATENNRVAQDFYDSPLWPKFRFWEWFTFACNGGERRSRDRVLRHLPEGAGLRLLDVAIGDGVYLDWLPGDWSIDGVDVSWSQLRGCLDAPRKVPRDLRLAQCSAEELPFDDDQFDVILSIGAFNYFNDPEHALREMARVARPGAPVVVSDELPNLTERMIGHKLGWPAFDHWFVSRVMNLGDAFTAMVERHRALDVPAIAERVLPGCRFERIWRGVGYVFVGQVPG